ncbi:nitrate/sulfonate/bicarbonate ABC transporter periplasmic protein [Klebsiella pneumoniae]|uniref:Nitrate/sulfonate/bicarbonate ABC transporter periplasmic protein n=1 Tax=Klebsiella pneumoniae TaxID=573 RepID=A0A378B104_KLEPN|nr:nitrate/sulfonate/bicarbonate ABC transporter periplasmic protein [Klebsiella pneumoniae]
MRLSFSGRVAAALMLLALGGYATAQERLTLRIADQKGGMRSQLEAANALQNLPYDIKWAEFPAAAPLAGSPQRGRPWTRGSSAMRRCLRPGQRCAGQSYCRG